MKHRTPLLAAALITISSPALALRVTNLDSVPHTITFDASGSRTEATLAPNETINIAGQTDGMLSLKSAHPKPSQGNLHSDGLLSGIVGVERDQNIPAYGRDDYVIWEGGQLQIQRRMKDHNRS